MSTLKILPKGCLTAREWSLGRTKPVSPWKGVHVPCVMKCALSVLDTSSALEGDRHILYAFHIIVVCFTNVSKDAVES